MSQQESEFEKKKKQNNIMEKFLEEYNQMKKDKEDLIEKMEKYQLHHNAEIENEREKNKKITAENAKLTKSLRELKNEIQTQELKFTKKESECADLRNRIDSKILLDDKTKDRDSNIFMKFLGRKPVTTNSQDQKLVTILNHFENSKDKLEKECTQWKKECDNLKKLLQEEGTEKNKISAEERNKTRFFDKVKEELGNQVAVLQEDNAKLREINQRISKNHENLQRDHSSLFTNHMEMKELYKQLRIDFQNAIHKHQEQYLQFQSIKTENQLTNIQQHQQTYLSSQFKEIQGDDHSDENNDHPINQQQKLVNQPISQDFNPTQSSRNNNHALPNKSRPSSRSKTPDSLNHEQSTDYQTIQYR